MHFWHFQKRGLPPTVASSPPDSTCVFVGAKRAACTAAACPFSCRSSVWLYGSNTCAPPHHMLHVPPHPARVKAGALASPLQQHAALGAAGYSVSV